jgi:putative sterol carrier protein
MNAIVNEAVTRLAEKLGDRGFDGLAKFVISGEGALMIDGSGVRAGDEEADVTLTATAAVFQALLDGDLNPAGAFMSGKLSVEGNMGLAMKLGAVLG